MLTSVRSWWTTLKQPRYASLCVVMLVVALGCIAAGTWQIERFEGKVRANDDIRANAHDPAAAVGAVLPLVGSGRDVSQNVVRYRTVTATGSFDVADQALVRNRSVDGHHGFLVLTPLRTTTATLLVVRGFVRGTTVPTSVAAPPAGQVTIRGRTELGESENDAATSLPDGQLQSINPGDQAGRLNTPLFDGFAELLPDQPGTQGIVTLPAPSLSNPAGGAVEPQHFAYIIQWYLFAVLAVSAPFAMARADRREQLKYQPAPDPAVEDSRTVEEIRAAKLADRYGH